ncbi:hypothetical protein [Flavihumibacter profundi]|uniref:hypothetical protein n=1 Tax=Flavihumibacter profundi TaxID=2716883 RepID=UPI001CC57804|nr:hypothetical protein [Flavihumibacter profundi]MBZ5855509.1 hypothetical protein [Flavihumibacter profundi]
MKFTFLLTTAILLLAGCQRNPKQYPTTRPTETLSIADIKLHDSIEGLSLDTIFTSGKQTLHIQAKPINNNLVCLTATTGTFPALNDTVSGIGLANPEFPDFNKDGHPDILLTYTGKNNTYFLYLFDPKTNKLISVDGFINYPNAIQLKSNPLYYYSYQSEGCSDLNWGSDLFRITNFRTCKIGHMYGKGCDFNVLENPQLIGIYKTNGNNEQTETIIEKLPYRKFIPHKEDKWDFLEKYWNNNYHKFK